MDHSEGTERFKRAPHSVIKSRKSSYCIAHACSGSVTKGHVFFVHADLLDYADNDGNLSHRDLECCRQYICWAGTLDKASCL